MHDKCILCKENMLQTDLTLVPSNLLFIFMYMVARTGLYWATTENLVFRPWHWRWLARKCRLKFWAKNSYYQSTSERNCNSRQFWSKISNMKWSDDITCKKYEETLTTKMTSTKHVNPDYTKVISCSMCENTFEAYCKSSECLEKN